jgi:small acid-soluble spore protein F (minor alpha/beta-type SASP)
MSRKKGVMSEQTKQELAKDLGFAGKVEKEGWSSITTGEAGSMVRRSVEMAEKQMVNKERQITVPRPDDQSGQTRLSDREPHPGSGTT